MRKFTFVIALVFVTSLLLAQSSKVTTKQLRRDVPSFTKKGEINSNNTKDAVWSNDFSDPHDWVISDISPDGAQWLICTEATAPDGYLPVYGMPEVFASTTAGNGFAFWNSDIQGDDEDEYTQDAWLQVADPIDLSGVATPRFIFETYYKRWNDVVTFDYSIDGGTTWVSIDLFPNIEQGITTTNPYIYNLNVPELQNQSSVLFRFHFIGDWDYGWFIDDISVIEAPLNDLVLLDARVNFFSAIDYHTEGSDYFHYSSHYGFLPDEIILNENAIMFFNAIVNNNGVNTADPEVEVKIIDPDGTEIYSFSQALGYELNSGELDTLDIAWQDGEEFLMTEDMFMQGEYTVEFYVSADGVDENFPEDNARSTSINATDQHYGKDLNSLDGVVGPSMWIGEGNDGDKMAVDFDFFEYVAFDTVWVYFSANSDPDNMILCHVMQYDEGSDDYTEITSSQITTITSDLLGTWVPFTFSDPVLYEVEEGTLKTIRIAMEFYYASVGSDLWIGEDNSVPCSFWGTLWNFTSETDGWKAITNYVNSVPMIRVQLPITYTQNNLLNVENSCKVFPNPTSNIVTVANFETASIQVVNMTGQVILDMNDVQTQINIDLSEFAQGTYFIRVIEEGATTVRKVNLVK